MSCSDHFDYYELLDRDRDMPETADFCITLSDDSMEPFFPRGSDVYVSASRSPAEFEAGIFFYNGMVLCRQWCEDFSGSLHLLPANPAFRDSCISIPKHLRDRCLCLGSVLFDGKLPRPRYSSGKN